MAPDSLTPAPADGQATGGAALPANLLTQIAQFEEEVTRLQQEGQSLREEGQSLREQVRNLEEQAAQKDQRAAAIRAQLAKLSGAQTERIKVPQIGQTIEGKGIYMGVYAPKDESGQILGKIFAVYAAPEDLTDESGKRLVATFQDHAKRMTALKGWHGHDGFDSANDAAIYQGLADGSAVGKWFIPTKELLTGTNQNGKPVQADNLLAHKDRLGEITTSRNGCGDYDYPNYYVSSTEYGDDSRDVWCARPADGLEVWNSKDFYRMSCRPVRVEALVI